MKKKALAALIFFGLLTPIQAFGAITYIDWCFSYNGDVCSMTNITGSDIYIAGGISAPYGSNIECSYNDGSSHSVTIFDSALLSTDYGKLLSFDIIGPNTGTVTISCTGTPSVMLALAYSGVSQSSPRHNHSSQCHWSVTSDYIDINSATGEQVVVFSHEGTNATNPINPPAGGALRHNFFWGGEAEHAGETTVHSAWGGTPEAGNFCLSGWSIIPTGGGPPATTQRPRVIQ